MGHTYTISLFHCVFSTRDREPLISPEMRERLWPFIGGIARENKIKPLEVGGYSDHAHMLLWLPATMAISKAMQLIKSGSSKFVHETFARVRGFEWQEGYGAFSIGVSDVDKTIGYIKRQEEHHRVKTFQEQYVGFLKEHGIEYDERYVFG